jgi:hypothetical protein
MNSEEANAECAFIGGLTRVMLVLGNFQTWINEHETDIPWRDVRNTWKL